MGRKLKKLSERKSTLFNIDCRDNELMGDIQEICRREGKTFNEVAIWAFREFNERHGSGNNQTMLPSYAPGGTKSDGQIENEVFHIFHIRFTDIYYREVVQELKLRGFNARKLVEAAKRVCKSLSAEGLKVYR